VDKVRTWTPPARSALGGKQGRAEDGRDGARVGPVPYPPIANISSRGRLDDVASVRSSE
jgi:hypothetical protein